jgi:hypothetical protein
VRFTIHQQLKNNMMPLNNMPINQQQMEMEMRGGGGGGGGKIIHQI